MGIRSCPRSAGAASSDSANAACDRPGRHPQSLADRPPSRFLARAGSEPVKANPSGQLGDPGGAEQHRPATSLADRMTHTNTS